MHSFGRKLIAARSSFSAQSSWNWISFPRKRLLRGDAHLQVALCGALEQLELRELLSATTVDPDPSQIAPDSIVLTALDNYIAKPDASYTYSLNSTLTGTGYKDYIIDMTSQTWRTAAEVDHPVWKHWVQIIVPDIVTSNTAILNIIGGSITSPPPTTPNATALQTALTTGAIAVLLPMVPNEPLTFAGETTGRSEDEIIAYTYDKYLTTGDPEWPALLPMVKSAVRAMDTTQTFVASQSGGALHVDDFVVSGASKRGWTTWLTPAVDPRVKAIVPVVFDVLNMGLQMPHHKDTYFGVTQYVTGGYSDAIEDYTNLNIFDRLDTPEGHALQQIIDPYNYLDRQAYNIPKYSVNGADDEFFVSDSSLYYFQDLPGTKYLRYVPNASHKLNQDATDKIINFEKVLLDGGHLPEFSWQVKDFGTTIDLTTIDAPASVKLWQATNTTNRDFRLGLDTSPTWTSTDLSDQGGGHYSAHVNPPSTGATAFMIEMTYIVNGLPLVFTTSISTIPRFIPTIEVSAPGGTYKGDSYPATAAAKGVNGQTVQGDFTYTYYVGNTPTGQGTTTPPVNAGTYTVVASFKSTNVTYQNTTSAPKTFTIARAQNVPVWVGSFRSQAWYLDGNGSQEWDSGDPSFRFGNATDIPLVGDWNGNGKSEIGVFRAGNWYLDTSGDHKWGTGDTSFRFGVAGDIPILGDWNGDGKTDVGVFRNGVFYLDANGNRKWDAGDVSFKFGNPTDKPITGDWNGDGKTDVGTFRSGVFYLDANGNRKWGTGDTSFKFGNSTDRPVTGDWNADGKTDVGVVRGCRWYLDVNGNHKWDTTPGTDAFFKFGNTTDIPIVGQWTVPPVPASHQ
ncbi:MAG: PhoPQ-activated protein PqaA family protein [Planctomycetales bacterium]